MSYSADVDFVPTSYTELYEAYWDYTQAVLISCGIPKRDAADVGMTILTRLYERDILSMYQAGPRTGGGTTHAGRADTGRPTKFSSFLTAFLKAYVRHHRERIATHARREPSFTALDHDGTGSIFERIGKHYTVEGMLFDQARMTVILLRSRCDLVVTMDDDGGPSLSAVLAAIEEAGAVSIPILAKQFGVTRPVIQRRTDLIRRAAEQVREELLVA